MSSDKGNSLPNEQTQPILYEVTEEGSLGLLALGAEGIRAWRKKKEEAKAKSEKRLKDE